MNGKTIIELYENRLSEKEDISIICPICNTNTLIKPNEYECDFFGGKYEGADVYSDITLISKIKCKNKECEQILIYESTFKRVRVMRFETSSFTKKINSGLGFLFQFKDCIKNELIYPSFCNQIITSSEIPKQIIKHYNCINNLIFQAPEMAIVEGRKCLESIFYSKFPNLFDKKKYIPSLNNLIKIISEIDVSNKELFNALRIIGNKSAHSNLGNDELNFTPNDAILVSKVIETILYEYFIIPSQKKIRKEEINKLMNKIGEHNDR